MVIDIITLVAPCSHTPTASNLFAQLSRPISVVKYTVDAASVCVMQGEEIKEGEKKLEEETKKGEEKLLLPFAPINASASEHSSAGLNTGCDSIYSQESCVR